MTIMLQVTYIHFPYTDTYGQKNGRPQIGAARIISYLQINYLMRTFLSSYVGATEVVPTYLNPI